MGRGAIPARAVGRAQNDAEQNESVRRSHERVRINFNKSTLRAGKLLCDLVCKAAGEGCLSRSGCSGEKYQPMEGRHFKRQLLPDGKRQHGLREQAFAYALGQHDRVPSRDEFVVRQDALACDAIGIAHKRLSGPKDPESP